MRVEKYHIAALLLFPLFVLLLHSAADAWRQDRPVTPYGDFCPLCGEYGICSTPMSHEEAKKAMIDYYHKKGFNIELVGKKGRFIRVKVMHNKDVVDVIIFDRRTGRVRSIY